LVFSHSCNVSKKEEKRKKKEKKKKKGHDLAFFFDVEALRNRTRFRQSHGATKQVSSGL
jgi:hypothetical protein